MKHSYRWVKYKLLIILLATKWLFRINLGDLVIYKGNVHMVYDGVMMNYWNLTGLPTNQDCVPRKDCRKVLTFKNITSGFMKGYRFYDGYWFDSWVRDGYRRF